MFQRLALLALPLAMTLALPAIAQEPAKAKPTPERKALKNEAKGLALATETVEQITEAQMAVAARVYTGSSDCEFGQHVDVKPNAAAPGHFHLHFKNATYNMVPQETTTGAVRLEDKKNGIVWIQIPAKSMLMNAKAGQRMVDSCMHPEQRTAMAPRG